MKQEKNKRERQLAELAKRNRWYLYERRKKDLYPFARKVEVQDLLRDLKL